GSSPMAALPRWPGTTPGHPGKPRPARAHTLACGFVLLDSSDQMSKVMLRTDALAKSFTLHLQGGVRIAVLADVGLELHQGEGAGLPGPPGAGKSTLMRSL